MGSPDATAEAVLHHRQRMDSLIVRLRELKAEGATKIAFHPNGSVASVEFGPSVDSSEYQHDDPDPDAAPIRRVTGGLVPRASRDSQ